MSSRLCVTYLRRWVNLLLFIQIVFPSKGSSTVHADLAQKKISRDLSRFKIYLRYARLVNIFKIRAFIQKLCEIGVEASCWYSRWAQNRPKNVSVGVLQRNGKDLFITSIRYPWVIRSNSNTLININYLNRKIIIEKKSRFFFLSFNHWMHSIQWRMFYSYCSWWHFLKYILFNQLETS